MREKVLVRYVPRAYGGRGDRRSTEGLQGRETLLCDSALDRVTIRASTPSGALGDDVVST